MRHPRASQVPTIQHDHPADDRTDTTRRLEALLAPVKGVLSMNALLLETPLSAEQRDLAAGVRASAESLLEAINRILDVSLVEAGRLELADETFDLHAVISGAGAIVRPIATRKGLWLSVRLDPDLPVAVRGDAARVRQILLDLLGNAVKFTDRGSVQVRGTLAAADADRLRIRLEIVDTGSGVPSDQLLGLLRSRGAVEPDGPRRLGGSSLGLPVTRELVELMGGALDVVSAAGEGSRFTATITLRPGDDSALERHLPDDEGTIVGTPLAGRRVLLVDDHPVNRASAQAALQRLGADVDIAWTGWTRSTGSSRAATTP